MYFSRLQYLLWIPDIIFKWIVCYILWEKILFALNLQFPLVIILIVCLLDCYKLPYASDAWRLKNNVFSQFGLKLRLLPVLNHCLNLNVLYSCHIFFQLKKELSGKPLREALDDQTLPLCWKGRKPFESIRDVKKYFKTFALSFTNKRKSKTELEFPPEAYLIISVSPPFNSFPTFDFSSLIYSSIRRSLRMSMNADNIVFQSKGNACLGILNGTEVGLNDLNVIGGESFCIIRNIAWRIEIINLGLSL